MIWLLPGIVSFPCFLLFDIAKLQGRRYAPTLFVLGGLLLCSSTAGMLLSGAAIDRSLWRIICGVLALLFMLALLYVLFIALPAKKTYAQSGKELALCSKGVYALCRHPGGWCFLLMYWFLWLYTASTEMFVAALILPALNFGYIFIQDRYLFVNYIKGYAAYKKQVPFLLPTRNSICTFLKKDC